MSEKEVNKIIEVYDDVIADLKQEKQQLKEENERFKCLLDSQAYKDLDKKAQQRDLYKEVIEEVREYITSYSSIHTIQFGTEEDSLNDIELNKTLDEKTITEMTNRYLKVHDKVLQILDKAKGEDNGK